MIPRLQENPGSRQEIRFLSCLCVPVLRHCGSRASPSVKMPEETQAQDQPMEEEEVETFGNIPERLRLTKAVLQSKDIGCGFAHEVAKVFEFQL